MKDKEFWKKLLFTVVDFICSIILLFIGMTCGVFVYKSNPERFDKVFKTATVSASELNTTIYTSQFFVFGNSSLSFELQPLYGSTDTVTVVVPFAELNAYDIEMYPYVTIGYANDGVFGEIGATGDSVKSFLFAATNTWIPFDVWVDGILPLYIELGQQSYNDCLAIINISYLNRNIEISDYSFTRYLDVYNYTFDVASILAGGLDNITPYLMEVNGVQYFYIDYITVLLESTSSNRDATLDFAFELYYTEFNDYIGGYTYYDFLSAQSGATTKLVNNLSSNVNLLGSLIYTVNDFLNIEILPGITFTTLLLLALTIPLAIWLLKAWLGG